MPLLWLEVPVAHGLVAKPAELIKIVAGYNLIASAIMAEKAI